MRTGVVNGNGYECDICGKLLVPAEVIRVKSFINSDHTGGFKTVDCIGLCHKCYETNFSLLCGRGVFRKRKKIKKGGE